MSIIGLHTVSLIAANQMFDTHAHIVSDDNVKYPPDPISGALREGSMDNPMTAERLLGEMDIQGVTRAALVQRAHIYGYDNSYIIDSAKAHPNRFCAICVVDSTAQDAGDRAAYWLDKGAVGIRLTEPDRGADGSWLFGPNARSVWQAVGKRGANLSIQLYRWNRNDRLPELVPLLAEFAAVPVIVEHLSNMVESNIAPNYGVDAVLDAIAPYKNAYLKLTTINLARSYQDGIDVAALLTRLMSRFPADRLSWGSDVAQSPQSYAEMTAMGRRAAAGMKDDARYALLSRTAQHLFVR